MTTGSILAGRTAIVTGSGRGIGRGIALAFAEEGANVVVASRSKGSIDSTVNEIVGAGGSAVGAQCDVSRPEDAARVVAETVAAFGGLDILVNNAQSHGSASNPAPHPVPTPLEDFDDEHWDHTLRTGLYASYQFMKAAFPHLKESGQGRVINFGSFWGQKGNLNTVAYNATKEGIRGLTRTAAAEWGRYGITCNVINPAIESDAMRDWAENNPDRYQAALAQIPMRRYGNAKDDAGRIAVFIAGPDAQFLTGMTFQVDGGYFMYP